MSLTDYIQGIIGSGIKKVLSRVGEDMERTVYLSTKRVVDKVVTQIIGTLIILVSMIFFAVAATYFLIEYLHLTKTISFLIISTFILLIGLILKTKK